MKLNIRISFLVIFLLYNFLGCGKKSEPEKKEEITKESLKIIKLSAESIKQIKLEIENVKLQPLSGFISIPAKVTINQDNEAQVGSLVQGRVQKVFVKIGDYVSTGQILMTVDGFDIGVIKADFLKAKAELDYKKANFERQTKLFEEKIGSQKSVLETQAEYQKAIAEFKAEDNKIHSIGLTDDDIINSKTGENHTYITLPIKSSD